MEFVILGLLLLKPRTLYELNKTLAEKISLFYSASFGSISSAINKLLEKGWIELREHIERGRNKKIYTITAAGQSAFHDWLNSAIAPEKVKEPALTRLFFLGYLDPAQRIALITQHIASLEAQQITLGQLYSETEAQAIPTELHDIARFQKLTLDYGRDYNAFSLAWYRRLLAELQEQ